MTNRHVKLPQWLDDLIFKELGAEYCRTCGDMTVIDWDCADVLKYLGTYFPRSYAEAYGIFSDYLRSYSGDWSRKSRLVLLDFCCGTGGEILGVVQAMCEKFPRLRCVTVHALDGNRHALRLCERVLSAYQPKDRLLPFKFEIKPALVKVEDIYDLGVVDDVIQDSFDLVITFKAVCEFVSQQRFEERNPYASVAKTFMSKLAEGGLLCVEDVTSRNRVVREWLPRLMDQGLASVGAHVVARNEGFNEAFYVTDSHVRDDVSKVAWRIMGRE